MRKNLSDSFAYIEAGVVVSDDRAMEEARLFSDKKNYAVKTTEELKARRYSMNTHLRTILSGWAALLTGCWLWKVGEILVHNSERYHLSDAVLITLLGTTTLNVIGIITIVMTDLFNGKSEDHNRS